MIAGFIAEVENAPDELSAIANVMTAPPLPFLPPEVHGRPVVLASLAYAGPPEVGERVVAPLRALATPHADNVLPIPYPELLEPAPEDYHPIAAGRTMFVESIDERAAEAIVDRLEASTGTMSVTQLRVLGGAVARVPADATAFAHRASRIMVNIATVYESQGDAPVHQAWVSGLAAELSQGDSGAYAAFLGDEGEERVRAAYPGSTWDRLEEIKARYDPGNLFRRNQNIPPAVRPAAA